MKNVINVTLPEGKNAAAKAIKDQTSGSFYRADLLSAASARYSRLYRDVRIKKGVAKAARAKAGRNSRSA